MASSTLCFQPHPGSPIPSGLANAAISAATTPTRATTTPICLLDIAVGRLSREGRGGSEPMKRKPQNRRQSRTPPAMLKRMRDTDD